MIYKTEEKKMLTKQVCLSGGITFPVLTFADWEGLAGIRHCFTTREGGVSEGYLASLNFRQGLYDPQENIVENFRRAAAFFETVPERIVCAQQTHTANVRVVTEADAGKGVVRDRDYTDVDGLITDMPGVALLTFYADCVPLILIDPVRRAVGCAHSGWRGTVADMGGSVLRAMHEAFGTDPADVLAGIGSSVQEIAKPVLMQIGRQVRNEVERRREAARRQKAVFGIFSGTDRRWNRCGSGERKVRRP